MKILWVSHLIPNPPKAGVLIRSHYLLKELSKYHEVDLIAFNQKNLIEPYFDNFRQGTIESIQVLKQYIGKIDIYNCPIDRSKNTRLKVALRSLFSRNPYSLNWLESNEFRSGLAKMLEFENYDLVHFDTINLASYMDMVGAIPFSIDHHNVESHMVMRRAKLEKNYFKRWYFKQEGKRLKSIEQIYCKKAATNITCSDLDTDRFLSFIESKNFETIPNGVDTEFFTPSDTEPSRYKLIFIGTLDWYPNIAAADYLAQRIWPLIKVRYPELELHIIGSKPPKKLKTLADTDSRLYVHGFVNDIITPMQDSTVYVCPITDGGGTKLKILDAFSSGKAVVAHPIACEGLMPEEGVNVLLASTPIEFVEKISSLLDDPLLRKKLEKNARKHAMDNFSFTSIGKKLADHFSDI